MSRVGKCKKCGVEFNRQSSYYDIFDYPHQTWFKLCEDCYWIETGKGHIQLCNINSEGIIKEIN